MASDKFDFILRTGDGGLIDVNLEYPGASTDGYQGLFPDLPEQFETAILSGAARKRPAAGDATSDVSPASDIGVIEMFGATLYKALIIGEVRGALGASRGQAEIDDKALRIGIDLNRAPALARLPWEALYDAKTKGFLGIDPRTNIVRILSAQRKIQVKVNLPAKVRILFAVANPEGDLDAKQEVERIRARLSQRLDTQSQFERMVLEDVSQFALNAAIQDYKPDILHFIGHGGFEGDAGCLYLCSRDDPNRAVPLDTDSLRAAVLSDPPKLIFLNSCQGATASPVDRYAGVAQSLIGVGIPYVLAMQFPISDDAAAVFAERFYASIANGETVECAVTRGRNAIRSLDSCEFITPVLYCNGEVQDLQIEAAMADVPPAAAPPTAIPEAALAPATAPSSTSTPAAPTRRRWLILLLITGVVLAVAAFVLAPLSNRSDMPLGSGDGQLTEAPAPTLPPAAEPAPSASSGGPSPSPVRPGVRPSFNPKATGGMGTAGTAGQSGATGQIGGGGRNPAGGIDPAEVIPPPPPPPPPPSPEVSPPPPSPPSPPSGGGYGDPGTTSPPSPNCNFGPFIVFFDWNQSVITPEAANILDNAVASFANCARANLRLSLTGHTDSSGTRAANLRVGAQRTKAVARYVVTMGISVDLLAQSSRGESSPRVATADGIREIQNRRVEIYFEPLPTTTPQTIGGQ